MIAFIFLYNLRLAHLPHWLSAFIMKISDLTLTIYLLTWIPDGITYPIMVRIAPAIRDRYVWLLVTIPIALVSATLMALVVDWVFRPLHRWLMARLTKLLPKEQA